MMKSPDADAEHIFEWVAALVQHPERLEHRKKDSKPESEDEEEESPVKGSDLPWHAQLHTEEDFKNMKFKELWHRLRFFQMQHAQVEEVFQNLPLAKQNREVALRTNLNMVSRLTFCSHDNRKNDLECYHLVSRLLEF